MDPHLQGGAVFRERGAEEGDDGVKDDIDDVFLQDGISKTLLSFVTNLQRREHHRHIKLYVCVCVCN